MTDAFAADDSRQAVNERLSATKYLTFVLGPPEGAPIDGPRYRPDIEEREVVGPLLHPGRANDAAYRPGNEFASEYTALKVIWENFGVLFNRAKTETDSMASRLMMKAAAVELRSFMDALPRYGRLVALLPAHDGSMPRACMCLLDDERVGFNAAMKAFNLAREAVLGQLNRIRNKVAAHMSQPRLVGAQASPRSEALAWTEIEELWSLLDPGLVAEVVDAGDDLMECIRHLPLHEFFRFEGPTRLRLHVPLIGQVVGDLLILDGLSESLTKQVEGQDLGATPKHLITLPLSKVLGSRYGGKNPS